MKLLPALFNRPKTREVMAASETSGHEAGTVKQWLINAIKGLWSETASGECVTAATAMTVPAFLAAIRNISEDISKLPLKLMEEDSDGNKSPLRDDPLYWILAHQPNPDMTSMDFRQVLTAMYLMRGTGYAEIAFDIMGNIRELWPIHPDRIVSIDRRSDGKLIYEINNQTLEEFPGMAMNVGKYGSVKVDGSRIFRLPGFSHNGITGLSVLAMAAESIGVSIAAQKFSGSFFKNGLSVGSVLSHPQVLKEETRSNLIKALEEKKGSAGAGSNLLLEDGIKYERIGIPPNEAQMLESRMFGVVEIARVLRIHPQKLMDLSKTGYASAEHASLEYVNDSLGGHLIRWEECIMTQLLAKYKGKRFVKHNVTALLRGDMAARGTYYKTMRDIGAFTPNDVLRLEDLNPRTDKWGDSYNSPLNTAVISEDGEILQTGEKSSSSSTGSGESNDVAEPADDSEDMDEATPSAKSISAAISAHKKNQNGIFESLARRLVNKADNAFSRANEKDPVKGMANIAKFLSTHADEIIETMSPAVSALADYAQRLAGPTANSYSETALRLYATSWVESLRPMKSIDVDTLAKKMTGDIMDLTIKSVLGEKHV